MHYYIIGTDHRLQSPSPFRANPDVRLRDKIESIIRTHRVVLIAEEVDAEKHHTQTIFGRDLANSQTPRIHWLPIDMTKAQQKAEGIFEALETAQKLQEQGINAYAVHANDVRERYWLAQIREECKQQKIRDGVVLITCEYNHCKSLAAKATSLDIEIITTMLFPDDLKERLSKPVTRIDC